MNYLRGALSAASQYYKDLPPINPSTLTGAIDVIVIERPTEGGASELVCSPFHVRFGKWQVLRPGEKKVKVLVNGHTIPFDMKIGDAGEAFFVFETDEDVPEELITSPLLQATEIGQTNGQDPWARRFGAKEGQLDVESAAAQPRASSLDMNGSPQEPEFLDLNAPQQEPGLNHTYTRSRDISANSLDQSNASKPGGLSTGPLNGAASASGGSESGQPSGHSRSSAFVQKIGQVGKAVASAAEEDERIKFASLKARAATVRDFAASSLPLLGGENKGPGGVEHEADAGDEVLPRVDEREIRPPEVTYHHDVVLDVSGYHSKEASDRTILGDNICSQRTYLTGNQYKSLPSELPAASDVSRSPSPESLPSPSPLRIPRATSEPPEYGASSPPPPEYSWEWGAFPQRSPSRDKFSSEDSDVRSGARFPLHSPATVVKQRALSPPRSRSPIPEADGGRLEADAEDRYRVWLDFEGQRLGFELSLCGNIIRGEDSIEGAQRFDSQRVTFRQLLDDPGVVHSRTLVVRWDDEYICRSDDSPLMPALVNWRRRTLSSPASPQQNATEYEAGLRAPIMAPQPSTWSRWWSRNRTLPDVKASTTDKAELTATSEEHTKRPSLEHTESAPAAPLEQPKSTSQQSSVPFPSVQPDSEGKRFAKTLRLTSDQLKALGLKKGPNSITFSLSASGQVACTARIFVWDATDHIVISDIDGTITKSDALGHVFTMIGRDWTHLGVAKLYTDICRNGYKIMYLTSRAIGQADSTRDYLKGINQNNYQLPEGPVIMSPDRLLTSLHREVIMRKPETFKMACLRDIQRLFGTSSHNSFYAGFGNRITDALSYRSVNVPSARIFTIDSSGEVKMELLELAGYKSSYIHMTDVVDQMFPPINCKWAPEYTDFNYWRAPVTEYDLPEGLTAPPSPSLSASARSDTSSQTTLSRLRQFSLGRGSRGPSPDGSLSSSLGRSGLGNPYHGGHVRAAASLDRLGSFLPVENGVEYIHARMKDRDDSGRDGDVHLIPDKFFADDVRQGRLRNRPDSMPGSLDHSMGIQDPKWFKDRDMHGGDGEEHEDEETEDEEIDGDDDTGEEYAEEAAEEAFDDDLLATGEMETVPFL